MLLRMVLFVVRHIGGLEVTKVTALALSLVFHHAGGLNELLERGQDLGLDIHFASGCE